MRGRAPPGPNDPSQSNSKKQEMLRNVNPNDIGGELKINAICFSNVLLSCHDYRSTCPRLSVALGQIRDENGADERKAGCAKDEEQATLTGAWSSRSAKAGWPSSSWHVAPASWGKVWDSRRSRRCPPRPWLSRSCRSSSFGTGCRPPSPEE